MLKTKKTKKNITTLKNECKWLKVKYWDSDKLQIYKNQSCK